MTIGCQKKESTKEEVYQDFQKKIYKMKGYTCKAKVTVAGNKSPQVYEFSHSYNRPDNYRLEAISPEYIRGKMIEYKGDKVFVKNPKINDVVELPNEGKKDQYLFIGDFIKNYLQNEEVKVNLSHGNLVLETKIPGDTKYFNTQVLYVNSETRNPVKLEIKDDQGKSRFVVDYSEFKIH
jgi:outer membrane lipoprotein-sorting protein